MLKYTKYLITNTINGFIISNPQRLKRYFKAFGIFV